MKKTISDIVLALLGAMICVSCGHSSGGEAARNDGIAPDEAADSLLLQMPAVPDSLRTVEGRAGFLAVHFWDAMDWKDRSRSLDTAFVEQNFANYLTVLPLADSLSRTKGVETLMKSAEADSAAYGFLGETAAKYLGDPNSPMRDEELYILFLRELTRSPLTDRAVKMRYDHHLEAAMKNRPGSRAADFRLADAEGRITTLHELAASAPRTVVLFYDPDCDHCKETVARLASVRVPEGVRIAAVDVMGDRERFEATKNKFPSGWRLAFALDPIEDRGLYVLPALPSLYLLNRSAQVLLKDAPIGAITQQLDVDN